MSRSWWLSGSWEATLWWSCGIATSRRDHISLQRPEGLLDVRIMQRVHIFFPLFTWDCRIDHCECYLPPQRLLLPPQLLSFDRQNSTHHSGTLYNIVVGVICETSMGMGLFRKTISVPFHASSTSARIFCLVSLPSTNPCMILNSVQSGWRRPISSRDIRM